MTLNTVRDCLREFGIELDVEPQAHDTGIDATVTLSRGGQRQRYAAVVKNRMRISDLIHASPRPSADPLLVIGSRVNPRSAAAFRDAGIQYIDALGNAFLSFGDVYIDVQGRVPAGAGTADDSPRPEPANIFSARRSQVILVLLAWPHLSTSTVREIAAASGVSTGQVHGVLDHLQEAGFLVPGSRRLDRAGELLDLWAAAYPTGLGRKLEIATFHGDPARPVDMPDGGGCYFSGESARGSGIVRPATLTLYVDSLDPRLPARNRWDAAPGRAPNIFVRRKFWTSPYADEPSPAGDNAPWPLVYADLRATRDARLIEVAATWRARHARPGEV